MVALNEILVFMGPYAFDEVSRDPKIETCEVRFIDRYDDGLGWYRGLYVTYFDDEGNPCGYFNEPIPMMSPDMPALMALIEEAANKPVFEFSEDTLKEQSAIDSKAGSANSGTPLH